MKSNLSASISKNVILENREYILENIAQTQRTHVSFTQTTAVHFICLFNLLVLLKQWLVSFITFKILKKCHWIKNGLQQKFSALIGSSLAWQVETKYVCYINVLWHLGIGLEWCRNLKKLLFDYNKSTEIDLHYDVSYILYISLYTNSTLKN